MSIFVLGIYSILSLSHPGLRWHQFCLCMYSNLNILFAYIIVCLSIIYVHRTPNNRDAISIKRSQNCYNYLQNQSQSILANITAMQLFVYASCFACYTLYAQPTAFDISPYISTFNIESCLFHLRFKVKCFSCGFKGFLGCSNISLIMLLVRFVKVN